MAEWEKIMIGIVVFSIIVAAGLNVITNLGDEYSHTLNLSNNFTATNYVGNLSKLNVAANLTDTTKDVMDLLQGSSDNSSTWKVTEFGILLISGIGGFIKIIFSMITIPYVIIDILAGMLGLDNWIRLPLKLIITIVFMFIIARLIFKKDRV